jgi:hypothetical protein
MTAGVIDFRLINLTDLRKRLHRHGADDVVGLPFRIE